MRGEGKGLGERQGAAIRRPSILQSLDVPQPVYPSRADWALSRDFAVAAASHQFQHITLADSVLSVKTGTPVRPTPFGWVACKATESPLAFSAGHYDGGTNFVAWRAMSIETYQRRFTPGDKYHIVDVDDYGNIRLERFPGGPFVALSETLVLIDASLWTPPVVLPAPMVEPEVRPTFTPGKQGRKVREDHKPSDTFSMPGEEKDARKASKKLGQVPRPARRGPQQGVGSPDHQRH